MRFKTKLALGILMSILSTYNVYAANISDINIDNWDMLSEELQDSVEKAVEDIPDDVFKYYTECGGKVTFLNRPIIKDGYADENILGMYWWDDHAIEIPVMKDFNKYNIANTIAHEFAHFVYFRTYKFWSEDAKKELAYQTDYFWGPYHSECSDESETFAALYAIWKCDHPIHISESCENMIREADGLCVNIYREYKSKDEPGVISEVIADRFAKDILDNILESE